MQAPQGAKLPLGGEVGFHSLPDQTVNKCIRRGFDFNVMCVGMYQAFSLLRLPPVKVSHNGQHTLVPFEMHTPVSANKGYVRGYRARPLLLLGGRRILHMPAYVGVVQGVQVGTGAHTGPHRGVQP